MHKCLIGGHEQRTTKSGTRIVQSRAMKTVSYIDTPGLSVLMSDEKKASAAANVPLGRIGTPDAVGKVAVFLASHDNSYVNGVELFASGGVAQY